MSLRSRHCPRRATRSTSISRRTEPKSSSRSTARSRPRVGVRQHVLRIGAEFLLDLGRDTGFSKEPSGCSHRADSLAPRPSRCRPRPASRHRRIGADLDLLGRERSQFRIVVTAGLELRQGQRAIVQDDGGGIMRRQQRLELGFVGVEPAVQIECLLAQRDADLGMRAGSIFCLSSRSNSAVFMP